MLHDGSQYEPGDLLSLYACNQKIMVNYDAPSKTISNFFSGQIFDICPYSVSHELQTSTIWETSNDDIYGTVGPFNFMFNSTEAFLGTD